MVYIFLLPNSNPNIYNTDNYNKNVTNINQYITLEAWNIDTLIFE